MKSGNTYRSDRSNIAYKIHLVKAFEAADDASIDSNAPSIDNSKYDGFNHRVTPIETFVHRIAKAVGKHGGDASLLSSFRLTK